MASKSQKNRATTRKPSGGNTPLSREIQCSASNGGSSASASCNSGLKGDAKACMAEVRDLVGLPT